MSDEQPGPVPPRPQTPPAPASTFELDTAGDAERRRGLTKMRRIATGALILAALIFLLVHIFTDLGGVWGFIAAAAEAAMVGAIADWFAVTALFRHPLGLPIPHTAIIPRKKDSLGETLSEFVATNFLRKSTVAPKILSAHVTYRAGLWLSRPDNQELLVGRAAQGLNYVLDRVDSAAVESLTKNVLIPKLTDLRKAPVLGLVLERVISDGSHKRLIDIILDEAFDWLYNNPQVLGDQVATKAPSWVPKFVNSGIANRLQREVLGWLGDIRDRPDHKVRRALDEWLLAVAHDMQDEDSPVAERTESVLAQLLAHPSVAAAVVDLWTSLSVLLRTAIGDPSGEIGSRIRAALTEFSTRCVEDEAFAAGIDARLADAAGAAAESFGPELASVISDTIAGWDAQQASEKIELLAGRDLQFIRINGTVIGALVGFVLHAVEVLIP
ncbi:DUF445 domain-containing protein [Brevibacterium sp. 50QC2O2]|uniref:DUF445 domain-containing protein n=1 Tax=Brevibacterium sp. 50QC2O2 TaxID=2968459 RepID=UPI00211C36D1|nr:DUF445 domain-containing protein [Brevibacterium sp. 50QC2O2]MCQ9389943.1 DUF445 domain-containing protein [Brevibacterium sp. 50QC2O2]